MENSTESDNRIAARELARMLEAMPTPLKSLKVNRATLVTKLEVLMPFITTFVGCTCELLEMGRPEDASLGIDAYVHKFADALNISIEDSQSFCMCLVMMRLLMKTMRPLFESIAEKKRWEEWFQNLWGKETDARPSESNH